MGSIDRRLSAQGKVYYRARWREQANGPQHSKRFTRKADAERFLLSIEHSLMRGSYVDPAAGKITLEAYWLDYVGRLVAASGTLGLYEDSAARILPLLGTRPLAALRAPEIERALATLAGAYALGTVRVTWSHLRAVLHGAQREGRVALVPAIRLPRPPQRVTVPTDEAVELLYAKASPRMRIAVELAARAGLRRSEVLGLTLDRIDRERCTITVDRQAEPHAAAADPFRFAPRLKTANSYRVVPVSPETIERLPSVVEHELGLVMADGRQHYAGTVFNASWVKFVRRLELSVRFHDLRHHFATRLLAAGVNPKAVAKAAGMNATTLLETYAHVLPDDDERIRAALRRAPVVVSLRAEDLLRTSTGSDA